jgi:hypothetical protein
VYKIPTSEGHLPFVLQKKVLKVPCRILEEWSKAHSSPMKIIAGDQALTLAHGKSGCTQAAHEILVSASRISKPHKVHRRIRYVAELDFPTPTVVPCRILEMRLAKMRC